MATHEGRRNWGDGSGMSWAVYPAAVTDEDLVRDGWNMDGWFNGPGGSFANRPVVRKSLTRTLVTQVSGLDV